MAQIANTQPKNITYQGSIFFTRHGQCVSNVVWPIDDYRDEVDSFTSLGQSQAKSLGRYLK